MEVFNLRQSILILCSVLILINGMAQDAYVDPNTSKLKYGYFELAGSGGLGSLNFEKELAKKRLFDLHFRTGISLSPIDKNNGQVIIFPVMIHFIHGNSKHKLDAGIGQSFSLTTKGQFFILMPASFGYRLEPEDKKHFWRFSYTPIISYILDFQWQHWGGISFGLKF